LLPAHCLLLTAVYVATMGFPAVIWQQRAGRRQAFLLIQIRTMRRPSSDGWERTSSRRPAAAGVPDKLPQLFNILRGDMSFAAKITGATASISPRSSRTVG
jgi:lipopolysaccharide/colanic/teichoic acid biosynthesis glycosyltransferase